MKKPTVLIAVETSNRELISKAYVTAKLIDAGLKVVIGEASDTYRCANIIGPDVFLTQSMSGQSYRKAIYSQLLDNHGTRMVALDQEGGLIGSPESYCNTRVDSNNQKFFDLYLAWGRKVKEAITTYTSFPAEKILITGEPKYDDELKTVHLKSASEIKSEIGNFILVNTNFGSVNHYDQEMAKAIENGCGGGGVADDGYREERQRYLLLRIVDLIFDLSESMSQKKIIVRPHPSENFDYYRKVFEKNEKVAVIHQGDVLPWILAADVVIHNNCSTAIEAFIMGKPSIEFCPPELNEERGLPSCVSFPTGNSKDVIETLHNIMCGYRLKLVKKDKEMLHAYFGPLDGLSCERVTAAIRRLILDKRHQPKKHYLSLLHCFSFFKLIGFFLSSTHLYRRVRRTSMVGVERRRNFLYREQKFASLREGDLTSLISTLSTEDSRTIKVKKVMLAPDLFSIEKV
jgi:surface carbohydrate biosynthesis protein